MSHSQPRRPCLPRSPLIPPGRSLDLLWVLWVQFKLKSGPTPVCTCPQSLQPILWEQWLSIQFFHRCSVYQADCGDLIHCFCGCMERFLFLLFCHMALGLSFDFGITSACEPPSSVCSPPSQEGVKAVADLDSFSLRLGRGRDMAATTGMCRECLWLAGIFNSLRCASHSPGEVGPKSWDLKQWYAVQSPRKMWAVMT